MKTQHETILFAMQSNPQRLWKVSDFSSAPNKFNDQVGYKASSRMSELVAKGFVEVADKSKRIFLYKITEEGKKVKTLHGESKKEKYGLIQRMIHSIFSGW